MAQIKSKLIGEPCPNCGSNHRKRTGAVEAFYGPARLAEWSCESNEYEYHGEIKMNESRSCLIIQRQQWNDKIEDLTQKLDDCLGREAKEDESSENQ